LGRENNWKSGLPCRNDFNAAQATKIEADQIAALNSFKAQRKKTEPYILGLKRRGFTARIAKGGNPRKSPSSAPAADSDAVTMISSVVPGKTAHSPL